MKIGHVYLAHDEDETTLQFAALVGALDRLAIDQHVLVANLALARRLQSCPYVSVGPVVKTPIMAYCLMPNVDLVHVHDSKSGQAGLLLTLTRSIPFVITTPDEPTTSRNPIKRSILQRAQSLILPSDTDPDALIGVYRRTIDAWSELPQHSNCR